MTQCDARNLFLMAGPCGNRLEIIDHKVILLYGKSLDLLVNVFGTVVLEGPEKVDTSGFTKIETQSFGFVFYRIRQFDVCLSAAYKKIQVAILLEYGYDVFGACQVPIARSLDGVQ